MGSLCMSRAAEDFVAGKEFNKRLAETKRSLVGRKIVDVRWEQYHDDEISAVLVLDNGETIRGPVLGEYSDGSGFD
ncbi:MAG: hypothetical protein HY926_00955 [Elusimicrobia bacterium]|nr:hypothetical protein [Elusimicrobiota bacterium]